MKADPADLAEALTERLAGKSLTLTPLSEWMVDEVAQDRWLVLARDLADSA